MSTWTTSNYILSLIDKVIPSRPARKPTNWNDWLGEAPASHEYIAKKESPMLKELKILISGTKTRQLALFVATPAVCLGVSRVMSAFSLVGVPLVTTSFASVVGQHHSGPLGHMAQLGASILMMMSIKGLGSHETSKRGNYYGIAGVSTAVLTVIISKWTSSSVGFGSQLYWFLPVAAVGQYLGTSIAKSVQMDQMPELVAAFHSLTGLAAVLVGLASQLGPFGSSMPVAKMIEIFLGVSVGAATFSGSIAAAAKLHGLIPGAPTGLQYRLAVNVLGAVKLGLLFAAYVGWSSPAVRIAALCGNALVSMGLGTMLVLPVGGADLPIVISLLNALSGLATSATGFSMDNSLLVMTGALIASSGTILSEHMCKGINRSLGSVLMGGFGVSEGVAVASSDEVGEITTLTVTQMVSQLQQCKRVLVVPGYGMAVARCQSGVNEVFEELQKRGIEVVFGIHPVAGRLPGHMNVILSEAGIPYDVVKEMGQVNMEMSTFDMCLVLGANDIVNPATANDPSSPIFGMPAIECWNAKKVVVMKRSMNTGYSGVDNPLFYLSNTSMLFGDAKDMIECIHRGIVETDISEWPERDTVRGSEGTESEEPKAPVDWNAFAVVKNLGALGSKSTFGEKRIPISPKVCGGLRKLGLGVVMVSGLGDDCGWSDLEFVKNGARIVETEREILETCEVIVKVTPLTEEQLSICPPPEEVEKRQVLITSFVCGDAVDETNRLLESLAKRGLTTFNLNLVPRISRAQSMDILSSMGNLAGYKVVINAFHRIGKLSRSSVTAGGNIAAANVFVIGCGVAGLSAIATAHALGARVFATDVRLACKEQVESIGASFVQVDQEGEGAGGYAREVSAEFAEKQRKLYRDYCAKSDVVICTAMVPGKKAPRLISIEMVAAMKPGSIVVDLAAISGGNCELCVADAILTDPTSRVIIDGTTNYSSELAQLSSELFSQNILAFLENLLLVETCEFVFGEKQSFNLQDVIVRQTLVVQHADIMYPPPPLPVVAPAVRKQLLLPPSALVSAQAGGKTSEETMLLLGALALGTLGMSADHRTVRLVGDFVLSCVIGNFTVASVTPALHTPLIRYVFFL